MNIKKVVLMFPEADIYPSQELLGTACYNVQAKRDAQQPLIMEWGMFKGQDPWKKMEVGR